MFRRRRVTVAVLGLILVAALVLGAIYVVQTVRGLDDAAAADVPTEPEPEPTAPVPTGEAASGACPTESVGVGAEVKKKEYQLGDTVALDLVVTNNHTAACMIEVGTAAQVFLVRKDGDTVWSSEYCADPEADGDAAQASMVFAAGGQKRSTLRWTIEPIDENCNRSTQQFSGGTYHLVTALGGTESAPAEFTIEVPEPEPTEESEEQSDQRTDEEPGD